ncbi:hypothetical protein AB4Y32_40235 [Paraburkholderia phymatum]|uniref:Uncharacterized protein n=1 Tax=Paraburkholderia phymatum TaxID=148447 RepID=A0ACC6UDU9_9BURK
MLGLKRALHVGLQMQCRHGSALEPPDLLAVHAQVQVTREQTLDTQDVHGALTHQLKALAREVAQRTLLGRIDVPLRQ